MEGKIVVTSRRNDVLSICRTVKYIDSTVKQIGADTRTIRQV